MLCPAAAAATHSFLFVLVLCFFPGRFSVWFLQRSQKRPRCSRTFVFIKISALFILGGFRSLVLLSRSVDSFRKKFNLIVYFASHQRQRSTFSTSTRKQNTSRKKLCGKFGTIFTCVIPHFVPLWCLLQFHSILCNARITYAPIAGDQT